jgi:hypothetical protein
MVPKGQSIHVLFLQAAVRLSACMLLFSAVAKVMQPSTWVVLQTALFWVVLVPVILNAFIGCSLMFSPVSRGWLIALFLVGIVYVGFHLLAGVAECDCFGSWVILNKIAFYLAIASRAGLWFERHHSALFSTEDLCAPKTVSFHGTFSIFRNASHARSLLFRSNSSDLLVSGTVHCC